MQPVIKRRLSPFSLIFQGYYGSSQGLSVPTWSVGWADQTSYVVFFSQGFSTRITAMEPVALATCVLLDLRRRMLLAISGKFWYGLACSFYMRLFLPRHCTCSPVGSYCPPGASSAIPCAAGRFGSTSGLTVRACGEVLFVFGIRACGEVLHLRCDSIDIEKPFYYLQDPSCSGPCAVGYWCGAGSTRNDANLCNTAGFYCPLGSPSLTPW